MRFVAYVAAMVLTLGLAYSGAASRPEETAQVVAEAPPHRVGPAYAPAGVEVLMRHGW